MKLTYLPIITICLLLAAGCATTKPRGAEPARKSYTIKGKTYYPLKSVHSGFFQSGVASWYGPGFHGKKTASGEVYNMYDLTAAHSTLPLNTVVKVTNLSNKREVTVRVNDRGPFVGDRVIDLSLAAATKLDMVKPGTVPVQVTVLSPGSSVVAKKTDSGPRKPFIPPAPNPFYPGGPARILALLGS